jgi:radical SAM protein with 4Fe4S-binding SPASM domain
MDPVTGAQAAPAAAAAEPARPLLRLMQRGSLKIDDERERRFRPSIYWYISFRCNLACAHCSVSSSPWVDTSADLDTADAMRVVEQMAELNVGTALLSGGEFMLRPDACDIIRALGERGISCALETNGVTLGKAFVTLARELQEKGLLNIGISLDGGTRESHERLRGPHSFDRTVRTLHMLRDNGIKFNVQAVMNRSNIETVPQLFDLAESLLPELEFLMFAFLNPVGRGIELVQELGLRQADYHRICELVKHGLDRTRVKAIVKTPPATLPPRYLGLVFNHAQTLPAVSCQFPLLGVLPNGDITICAVSRDNQDLYFGNIRSDRLKDIWTRTRMSMLRSRYVAADDLHGICGDCIFKRICKGSCRAWAHEDGGDFDAPFPVCAAMERAGTFPAVYRISTQNRQLLEQVTKAESCGGGGCSCSH